MTMDEARALVTQLNLVFDIVRFVDVRMMQEYTFAEDGQFIGHPYPVSYTIVTMSGRRNVAVKIAFQRKLLSIVDV